MCFDEDIEAYGCDIDMIDGALETLDLTLSKRGMFEFASGFVVDVFALKGTGYRFFHFQRKKNTEYNIFL